MLLSVKRWSQRRSRFRLGTTRWRGLDRFSFWRCSHDGRRGLRHARCWGGLDALLGHGRLAFHKLTFRDLRRSGERPLDFWSNRLRARQRRWRFLERRHLRWKVFPWRARLLRQAPLNRHTLRGQRFHGARRRR
jgi:hypothetical protein